MAKNERREVKLCFASQWSGANGLGLNFHICKMGICLLPTLKVVVRESGGLCESLTTSPVSKHSEGAGYPYFLASFGLTHFLGCLFGLRDLPAWQYIISMSSHRVRGQERMYIMISETTEVKSSPAARGE